MKTKKSRKSYTKEIIEYQSKQYLPGAYLGGDMPPEYSAQTKAGALLLFFWAIVFIGVEIYMWFFDQEFKDGIEIFLKYALGIFWLAFIVLSLLAARKMLKNSK